MDAEIRVCLLFALTSVYLLENPHALFLLVFLDLVLKSSRYCHFLHHPNRLSYAAALPGDQRATSLLPSERTWKEAKTSSVPRGWRSDSAPLSQTADYLAWTQHLSWQAWTEMQMWMSVSSTQGKHNCTDTSISSITCAAPHVASFLTHNSKSDTVGFNPPSNAKRVLVKIYFRKAKIHFLYSFFCLQLLSSPPPPPLSCDAKPLILQPVSQIIYA